MADNPNVGPDPVEAKPNHAREKTFKPTTPPTDVKDETQRLPEKTTEEKVRKEMPAAVEAVKKRV